MEWEAAMTEVGVPAGRVFTVPEILSHPHMRERGFSASLPAPFGTQHITRGGFYFPEESSMPVDPAPALSQHTPHWLQKLGYTEQAIREFKDQGVI